MSQEEHLGRGEAVGCYQHEPLLGEEVGEGTEQGWRGALVDIPESSLLTLSQQLSPHTGTAQQLIVSGM